MSLPRSGKCHITVHHQYGMTALISQTSFHGETSGGTMKCQQFSEVTFSFPLFYLYYSTSLAHLQNQERNDLKPILLRTSTSDFLCFFFHFSTTKSTDILVFFSGLLKMLSFGFQKLKIFLLLKTLERFVRDCHLNPLMFKQFFSLDKKVVFKLTFQRDCGVFGSLFLLN